MTFRIAPRPRGPRPRLRAPCALTPPSSPPPAPSSTRSAVKLQRPLPDNALTIISIGEKAPSANRAALGCSKGPLPTFGRPEVLELIFSQSIGIPGNFSATGQMSEVKERLGSSAEDGRYRLLIEAVTDYAIYMPIPWHGDKLESGLSVSGICSA